MAVYLDSKEGRCDGQDPFIVSMPLGSDEKHGNWGILRLLATTPEAHFLLVATACVACSFRVSIESPS